MKKFSTVCLTSALIVTTLSACSGNSGSSESPGSSETSASSASSAPAESKSPVAFTIVHNQGEYAWPSYDKIVADYNEKSGNKATLKYIPAQESESWLQAQFIAHSEPEIVSGTSGRSQPLHEQAVERIVSSRTDRIGDR